MPHGVPRRDSRPPPDLALEAAAHAAGAQRVAGVDEAGRGPLAGPVVAAAVILDPSDAPEGLDDSKRLSPARREALAAELRRRAAVSVASALGRGDRRAQHLGRHGAGHAARPGAAGPRPRADRRTARAAGARLPGPRGGGRRRALGLHRGRVHHRQGDARRHHGGARATRPALRLGAEQRISDRRASCGAPDTWGRHNIIGAPSPRSAGYCVQMASPA